MKLNSRCRGNCSCKTLYLTLTLTLTDPQTLLPITKEKHMVPQVAP